VVATLARPVSGRKKAPSTVCVYAARHSAGLSAPKRDVTGADQTSLSCPQLYEKYVNASLHEMQGEP
jgi:hypothetical protein